MTQFLILDLGATKCAAALVSYQNNDFHILERYQTQLCDCSSLEALIFNIESSFQLALREIKAICIAGAGQYNGKELILDKAGEGYPFPMKFAELALRKQWQHLYVVHDYTPIIYRTFIENNKDISVLNHGTTNPLGRRVVFGIGTGLGMKDAVLLPNGDIWIGANEIGHIGLSSPPRCTEQQFIEHLELIKFLNKNGRHLVTFESILSGPGLALLYQFVKKSSITLTPEETALAIAMEHDTLTLPLFATYLGLFISIIQLSFMPNGGIWISGGVLQKHLNLFEEPLLSYIVEGIALSPSYLKERNQFSLKLMLGQDHVFLGGAFFLLRQLQKQGFYKTDSNFC